LSRMMVTTSTSLCVSNTVSSCWLEGLPSTPCAPCADQKTWNAVRE
jgi:hypothetical protein